jgi:hypothetical protein
VEIIINPHVAESFFTPHVNNQHAINFLMLSQLDQTEEKMPAVNTLLTPDWLFVQFFISRFF